MPDEFDWRGDQATAETRTTVNTPALTQVSRQPSLATAEPRAKRRTQTKSRPESKPRVETVSQPKKGERRSVIITGQTAISVDLQLTVKRNQLLEDEMYLRFKWQSELEGSWQAKQHLLKLSLGTYHIDCRKIAPDLLYSPKETVLQAVKEYCLLRGASRLQGRNAEEQARVRLCSFLSLIRVRNVYKKSRRVQAIQRIKNRLVAVLARSQLLKQVYRTINFSLEAYSEMQRRYAQEDLDSEVQIHLPGFGFSGDRCRSMRHLTARQNILQSRLIGAVLRNVDVIFIHPVEEVQQRLVVYLTRLLERLAPDAAPRIKILLLSSKQPFLQSMSCDRLGYLLASHQFILELKKLIAGRPAVIVPYINSLAAVKLAAKLQIPVRGGALQLKYSARVHQDFGQALQSTPATIKPKTWFQMMFNEKYRADRQVARGQKVALQIEFYKAKLTNIRFAAEHFFDNRSAVRDFILGAGLPILPGASLHAQETDLVGCLANLIAIHKSICCWVFKLNEERFGRGCAEVDSGSIKVLNDYRKSREGLDEKWTETLRKISKFLFEEKLKPAHTFLRTRQQYRQQLHLEGGLVEARLEGLVYQLFFKVQNDGRVCYEGACQKHQSPRYVVNLLSYPAQVPQQFIDKAATLCQKMSQSLGIAGYVSVDLLRSAVGSFYFGASHGLGVSYSGWQLCQTLQCGKPRACLYSPYVEHKGLRGKEVEWLFQKCRASGVRFDVEQRLGTLFLFLGKADCQQMSLVSVGKDKGQAVKLMTECLNFLLGLSAEISRSESEGEDSFYLMDLLACVRELNKQNLRQL